METLFDQNRQFLIVRFPVAWQSFQNAPPVPEAHASNFEIPLPNGREVSLRVDAGEFLEASRRRLSSTHHASGALVWGVSSPDELVDLLNRFSGKAFLYVETDPDVFAGVLKSIPLQSYFSEPNRRIAFVGDCGLLMAEIALAFGDDPAILTRVWTSMAPSLLVRLLDDRHPVGSFVSFIVENVYLNQSEEEKERRNNVYQGGATNPSELFTPDYIFQAMIRWLNVYLIAAPGIRTLYRDVPANPNPSTVLPASIVILAWNRWDLTERCLRSILHYPLLPGTEILVVDNGSTDFTPHALKRLSGEVPAVRTLRMPSNLGPAGGREAAFAEARGRTLIFLDNDVEVKHARWMEILLEPLILHPRIGASGSFGVIHTSDETETWTQKILFPGLAVPVGWISSYCLAVRRQALQDAGGWRPDLYHLYGMEDVALGWALRAAGWVSVVPGQFVPVSHGMNHKDGHYDYDYNLTGQKNTENFRRIWGAKHRILNLARDNRTLNPREAVSGGEVCVSDVR